MILLHIICSGDLSKDPYMESRSFDPTQDGKIENQSELRIN